MRFYKKLDIAFTGMHKYLMSFDVKKGDKVVKEFIGYDNIEEYDGRDYTYEIIRGIQKLYFDIDSSTVLDDEVREFIEHCKSVYDTDIVCYTSHREGKYSYHIVLQDIYARDNVQCKYYCKKLLEGISLEPYCDMKVYRDVQHFRLMGCSKLGIDNKKIVWIGSIKSLEDSLITFYEQREGVILLDYNDEVNYCNMSRSAYQLRYAEKKTMSLSEYYDIIA